MKNLSNQKIKAEDCTICPTCHKPSWYIMKCDCGYIFCKNCSYSKNEKKSDTIVLECPKCRNIELFI